MRELKSGISCVDNYKARGRKKIESHLPRLLDDLKSLVDSQTQTDPSFKSNRLYTRLSAREVRCQLIERFGYSEQELPTAETIRLKLNKLGYCLKRVAKTKPQKKFPLTEAIFEQLAIVNEKAEDDPQTLRISMDALI